MSAENPARETRLGETEPEVQGSILAYAEPGERPGEAVGKIASSRTFISQDTEISAIAAAMDKDPGIFAVGVVDGKSVPQGLVLRRELFDLLGKPYGREYYKKKPVSMVMKSARVFRDDHSILGVADSLAGEMRKPTSTHYLLADVTGRFSGVFSTKDLLIYLSDITSRDIALARRLQEAIVKESALISGERTVVLGSSSMANEVGGDFYVQKRLVDGKFLVAICDVSGKGIAASLITAVLGGFFDGYTASNTVKGFVRRLNRYLYDTFRLEYFVTGIIIEFNEDTGEAVVCDMGHSYMLIMEGERLLRLGSEAANPPLGVSPNLTPVTRLCRLKPGDVVVLFTDGVIDQIDGGGETFTERRLWELLKSCTARAPHELSHALSAGLASFRGDEPQRDDVTYVIMRYGGPSAATPSG
jgi:sigma-B regulation protein RsbU (phosphoserine phosphatase)